MICCFAIVSGSQLISATVTVDGCRLARELRAKQEEQERSLRSNAPKLQALIQETGRIKTYVEDASVHCIMVARSISLGRSTMSFEKASHKAHYCRV